VVSLSATLDAQLPVAQLSAIRKRFSDSFFYILYFQEVGVAERELEVNAKDALERIYFAGSAQAPSPGVGFFGKPSTAAFLDGMALPAPKLPWLDEAALERAASAFAKTGFRGPLSRYRNIDRDWENAKDIATNEVSIPALFITGERDVGYVYDPACVERMRLRVTGLREVVVVPNAGHWVQQEAPAETTSAIARFGDALVPGR
jgi:pimeloyl-ACP methyl ester carboxylesterase